MTSAAEPLESADSARGRRGDDRSGVALLAEVRGPAGDAAIPRGRFRDTTGDDNDDDDDDAAAKDAWRGDARPRAGNDTSEVPVAAVA